MDPADLAAIRAALGELGEELDPASGFSVEPKKYCPHLKGQTLAVPADLAINSTCVKCGESEVWVCGICGVVLCSRYKKKHMVQHVDDERHPIGLSLSDLSIWCFQCDSYLDVYAIPQLQPLYSAAHLAKFGEKPYLPGQSGGSASSGGPAQSGYGGAASSSSYVASQATPPAAASSHGDVAFPSSAHNEVSPNPDSSEASPQNRLDFELQSLDEKLAIARENSWCGTRMSGVDAVSMHGIFGQPGWEAPRLVTYRNEEARPGYASRQAHEYEDEPGVLLAKVKLLKDLVCKSHACVVYTGAGISTASGIDDYASKKGSIAMDREEAESPFAAKPTLAHHVLVQMQRAGQLKHWIQQNHDGLPQKAGLPQECINEIHGAWFDPSNPVAPMSGSLRGDLMFELEQWKERADLVLALGTSLVGMNADDLVSCLAERAAAQRLREPIADDSWTCKACTMRNDAQMAACSVCGTVRPASNPYQSLGSVIVGLQCTQCDHISSLRIFGTIDSVCALLARELNHSLGPQPNAFAPASAVVSCTPTGAASVLMVPYDANGARTADGVEKQKLDLNEGALVMLTGGPGEGYVGRVLGRTAAGHVRLRLPVTREHSTEQGRSWHECLLGSWWLVAAANGTVPQLPIVNSTRNEQLPKAGIPLDADPQRRFDYKRKQEAVLLDKRRRGC